MASEARPAVTDSAGRITTVVHRETGWGGGALSNGKALNQEGTDQEGCAWGSREVLAPIIAAAPLARVVHK